MSWHCSCSPREKNCWHCSDQCPECGTWRAEEGCDCREEDYEQEEEE